MTQRRSNSSHYALLAILGHLLAAILLVIPRDQGRHLEIHFLLHIQMTILVANRQLLALDLLGQRIRSMHAQAPLPPSFSPTNLVHAFFFLVNRHRAISFQSMVSMLCCSTKRFNASTSNRNARPTLTEGNSRNRAFL